MAPFVTSLKRIRRFLTVLMISLIPQDEIFRGSQIKGDYQ